MQVHRRQRLVRHGILVLFACWLAFPPSLLPAPGYGTRASAAPARVAEARSSSASAETSPPESTLHEQAPPEKAPPALTAGPESTVDQTAGVRSDLPAELAGKPEIVAARTLHSATFDLGDNRRALLQETQPLNYQDAHGQWQAVNPRFEAVEGGWVNTHNTLQTSVAQDSSRARLGLDQIGVGWEPHALQILAANGVVHSTLAELLPPDAGALPGLRSDDSHALHFTESWSEKRVTDRWQLTSGGAEYGMELAEADLFACPDCDGQWLELVVQLHLKPGTTVQVAGHPVDLPVETGSALTFVDSTGAVLVLQPPVVFEQARPSLNSSGSYVVRRGDAADMLALGIRFPLAWIKAPARRFPLVIDPLFQTMSPITAKTAFYGYDRSFHGNRRGVLNIGSFNGEYGEALLHFAMPTLPPGAAIDRAYLVVAPSDTSIVGADQWTENVHARALGNSDWRTSDNAAPAPVGARLPFSGLGWMEWSGGRPLKLATTWDVTQLARQWHADAATNHGIVVAADTVCDAATCGGFFVDQPSGYGRNGDTSLHETESASTPDGILWTLSTQSGARLLVFYDGPVVAVGQRLTAPAPSEDPRYFHADHAYSLPPLENVWQVVAVRGLTRNRFDRPVLGATPPFSVEAATSTDVAASEQTTAEQVSAVAPMAEDADPAVTSLTPVYGELPRFSASIVKALYAPQQIGYWVLNGRRQPGLKTTASVRRVETESERLPESYDIQLVREGPETIAGVLNTATVAPISFSEGQALGIYNITLPPNAMNRVDVLFAGTQDGDVNRYLYWTQAFSAQLFYGNGDTLRPRTAKNGSQEFTVAGARTYGQHRLGGQMFASNGANAGLVLAFNDLYVNYCGTIGTCDAPGNPDVFGAPPDFDIRIRVTSCAAGSLPTPQGDCQKVDCPAGDFDIANNFRVHHNLGIWSGSGWTVDGTTVRTVTPAGVAPLIGGPATANSPTVAVLGGVVEYSSTALLQRIDIKGPPGGLESDVSVVLIECTPGQKVYGNVYEVQIGSMTSSVLGDGRTVLRGTRGAPFFTPWVAGDDIYGTLYVHPLLGRTGEFGSLARTIGPDADANKLQFAYDWSMTAAGVENSLAWNVNRLAGGSAPDVAGLRLDLGSDFDFDFDPLQQSFVAIRATGARISQPETLGGASKLLQALIFPTGQPIPSDPVQQCGWANCVDLRSQRDTFGTPDRAWAMPDIHLSDKAGLVAISSAGALQVYSADFPADLRKPAGNTPLLASAINAPAATSDFDANFSYDTFGARVKVSRGRCVETDTQDVEIIEGATFISLPSIGGSGDDSRIGTSFKLCQSELRQVHMEFRTPVGVPLGNSGLFLTGLEGTVDIYPGHTTIKFGIDIQAAPGGDGGILKLHGDVTIDTRGLFAFQGSGTLLKGIVGAQGALWVGWSPLDIGFRVSVGYPLKNPWVSGMMRAHMWQGQGFANRYSWLPDNDEIHIAAEISGKILIREGQAFSWWFIDIPPSDIHFEVALAFGQFCTNGSCTTYEWGIKGKFTVAGYDVGLYYTFGNDLTSPEVNPANLSFILGNDGHLLIDQYNGATDLPLSAAGVLEPESMDHAVSVYRSPNAIDAADDLIPFAVSEDARQLLFGLGWQAGTPHLTLIQPDGAEIGLENATEFDAQFINATSSTLVGVQNPMAGDWQARLSNLSDAGIEHYQFTYFANRGAPVVEGDTLLLTPATPDEVAFGAYRITWRVPDNASPRAAINLFASRVAPDDEDELEERLPIVQHWPLSTGAYDWALDALPFASYRIEAQVDDGINDVPAVPSEDLCNAELNPLPTLRAFAPDRFAPTSWFVAPGTVQPNDLTPPLPPSDLTVTPQDGALLARWQPSPDPSIVLYRVTLLWSPGASSPNRSRTYSVTPSAQPSLRMGALQNGKTYTIILTAEDVEGKSTDELTVNASPEADIPPLPGAPTQLAVNSVAATSAVLTWIAGPGTPPDGYRISVRAADAIEDVLSEETNANTYALTGLTPGVGYEAWVTSLGAGGWTGGASATVRFVATSGQDADGDGLADDWATRYGVQGSSVDTDSDGLTNGAEADAGTDPTRQNSDDDSFSDAEEVSAGTDPLDARSHGAAYTQPRLQLDQDRLVFRSKGGAGPSPATISWRNTGGGKLVLGAESSALWLNAVVDGDQIQVSVDARRLAAGPYTGVIALRPTAESDPLIGGNPAGQACIRVRLWASPPGVMGERERLFLPIIRK